MPFFPETPQLREATAKRSNFLLLNYKVKKPYPSVTQTLPIKHNERRGQPLQFSCLFPTLLKLLVIKHCDLFTKKIFTRAAARQVSTST
jgi:hypothetical protein